MEENEEEINKIRKKISSRNPHAFHTKLKVTDIGATKRLESEDEIIENKKVQHVKG